MRILVLNNDHITRQAAQGLLENGYLVTIPEKRDDYTLNLNELRELLDKDQPDFCLMRNRRVLDRGFNPYAVEIECYLRSQRIPCVSWFTENPLASGSMDSITYFFLKRDENFLTLCFSPETAAVLKQLGHKAGYLPLAASPGWFSPMEEHKSYLYEVSFIGRPKVIIPPQWQNGHFASLVRHSLWQRHQNVIAQFAKNVLPGLNDCFLQAMEKDSFLSLESFDAAAESFDQMVNLYLAHQLRTHLMFEAARLSMLKTLGWLFEADLPVKLFGGEEWQKIFPQAGEAPLVRFEEQGEIYNRSKINLVLSKIELRDVVHERVFNIAACRGFSLAEHREAILGLFPEGEIPTFRDREELLEKTRYYLLSDKERRDLAGAAHERVMRDHTFRVRMEQMVGMVKRSLLE